MPDDAASSPARLLPGPVALRWSLLGVALAVNLWTMYAPSVPGPPSTVRLDLLGHAATFAALALTGLWAGLPARWLLPLVVANGAVSELVQHVLLPRRSGDLTDLAADVVGVALGWAAHRAWTARRSRRLRERARAHPADDR